MRERTMKSMKSAVLLLVAAGLLGACAEEREPINRVQPYALPKSFFIGEDKVSADDNPEFWTQNTLINVGYGAAQDGLFTSTYAQPMSRIKWQITEDMLIGRASYERIVGSDGLGTATGDETEDGNVAVAFGISSQFDIVNSYNSTTGEKLNVVEENNYDRPWYEREYIRVDFSKSLMNDNFDFDTASLVGLYGSITYEPMTYYVSDPLDAEAPVFDLDNGYFDVTTKMWAKPGLIDLSDLGWGINEYPACYLDGDFRGGSSPSGNCNPVELTLRQSFRRVENHDLTPIDNDGWRFQAFGAFAFAERRGFSRQYGMTDNEYHRFQSLFPIWERSHYYSDPAAMTGPVECYTPDTTPTGADVHRDDNSNGTEDECEAVTALSGFGGSKCDEFSQKCTLPYRARTVKPMPWYVTNGSDLRFYEPTAYATHQWDSALRSAVVTAKYTECMSVELAGAAQGDSEALAAAKTKCFGQAPVYYGQTDANEDLMFLGQEMDDCRNNHATAFAGVTGAVGSTAREDACAAIVQQKGTAIGAEAGVIAQAKMPEVLTLCHSPVQQDDAPMCGTAEQRLPLNPATNEYLTAEECNSARANGDRAVMTLCAQALNVRIGDLRYHQVNLIETPQTPSPWGIMVSSIDPTNGETISSSVNVWTYVNDFWAQRVVDWMRFAAGELSAADVTEGKNIKDWTDAAKAAEKGGVFGTMTKTEVNSRVAAALNTTPTALAQMQSGVDAATAQKVKDFTHLLGTIKADARTAGQNSTIYRARMKAVAGTTLEAELMNTQMQELYGVQSLSLTDGVLDMVSPLRGGNPALQNEIKRLKQNALGERGMCELEMADTPVSIQGLSAKLQEKFGAFNAADDQATQQARAAKIATFLMRWSHQSVIAHEMGHAVGHRHNFVSSSDAWNYMPQYWALRTKAGAVTTECTDVDATGEDCIGPRYFDPVTPNESDNLIWMWMFSSIMDYAGETTQDLLPIGSWDFAATRLFYGDSVAVHNLDYMNATRKNLMSNKLDNFGGITGYVYWDGPGHYSLLAQPSQLDLIPSCAPVTNVNDYKPSRWDTSLDGTWSPLLDGHIVSVDGTPTRCRQQPVDYMQWNNLSIPADYTGFGAVSDSNDLTNSLGWVADKFGRWRVPYGFATDHWADLGNVAVYRHDNGADPYEIFNFFVSQQEMFSIFDNYRRGRSTFTVSGATSRIMDRYLYKIRDGAKGLALYKNIYNDFGPAQGISADSMWQYAASAFLGENVIAAGLVFDHFARNEQRPAPGPHGESTVKGLGNVLYAADDDIGICTNSQCQVAGTIPNGAYASEGSNGGFTMLSAGGKIVENQLAQDQGDYNSSFTTTAGSYYDKIWMSMLFTESVDNFISESRTDFVDKRYRSVSLAELYADGFRRWLANNLTNDNYIKGAHIPCTANHPECPFGAKVECDVDGNGVIEESNSIGVNETSYTNYCIPNMDADEFWTDGIGWTKWWGDEVQACFPKDGTNICSVPTATGGSIDTSNPPEAAIAIDPQLGWEVQKFLVTWTYIYLPENQMHTWRDQMRMYSTAALTDDTDLTDKIVFYNPVGNTYVANRYGKEEIYGKTVEKGISARVLQYANELLNKAYVTNEIDFDGDGVTDWYEPVLNEDGEYTIKYDDTMSDINGSGTGVVTPADCSEDDNSGCTCDNNRACIELDRYISVIDWMAAWSGFADYDTSDWNDMIGVYN
jgi:hypothetical protein